MSKTILATLAILASADCAQAATLPDELVKALTETIEKHCPEAKIEVTDDEFVASSKTMVFTLHVRSASGEVFPRTYQEEGPTLKGFMLRVSLKNGKFPGATAVPQTMQEPYFKTFLDAPEVENAGQHYQVKFSYGNGLNPTLKKAILEAVPRSKTRPVAPPDSAGK